MQIKSLQISNILSFPHHEDISNAQTLTFDPGLNIIIGENGAGKSTALEVLNFIFKRVLYRQYTFNQDLFLRRQSIDANSRRQTLIPSNENSYTQFRLSPNWSSEDGPQQIRITVQLDEIDNKNIERLAANYEKLLATTTHFTGKGQFTGDSSQAAYTLDIILDKTTNEFSKQFVNCAHDLGFEYLSEYHYYREAISLYNFLNPDDQLEGMYESFTLISSYRNYSAFQSGVSLTQGLARQQMQGIRSTEYGRSLNTTDASEPSVFAYVRLRVAEQHYEMISGKFTEQECEAHANQLPFMKAINSKLQIVSLECKVRLLDKRTWQYSFHFYDLRRGLPITDINSLSAGQKAIVHLVFEAYGRDDLKGGVIIIDEPEIHLHYQFQHEYLQVIRELNKEQQSQYVLVTHSEALISSSTIRNVRRFSLDGNGHTVMFSPTLNATQKKLIQILDNTKSTYAFFAKKVVLVEGETDQYFLRSVQEVLNPESGQEIAILMVRGKGEHSAWKDLFSSFGLHVSIVSDLDYLINLHFPAWKAKSLKADADIAQFKADNPSWEQKIDAGYAANIYVLKRGDLEKYLDLTGKDLALVIKFCDETLVNYLKDDSNPHSVEVRSFWKAIVLA
jgi:predicted ATP-dependent endonuclease of OLD family